MPDGLCDVCCHGWLHAGREEPSGTWLIDCEQPIDTTTRRDMLILSKPALTIIVTRGPTPPQSAHRGIEIGGALA